VLLLAEVLPKIEAGKQPELLGGLLSGGWPRGPQAYGELLTIAALRGEPNDWADEEIGRYLVPAFMSDETAEHVRIGLAFAVARFWANTRTRGRANDILLRLMSFGSPALDEAIMDVFLRGDPLPADETTRELLAAVSAHPALLVSRKAEYLVRHMAQLLPHEADLVLELSEQIVARRREELRSIQVRTVRRSARTNQYRANAATPWRPLPVSRPRPV
jgi:hypothetical protein